MIVVNKLIDISPAESNCERRSLELLLLLMMMMMITCRGMYFLLLHYCCSYKADS